jgi:hypothetical protein
MLPFPIVLLFFALVWYVVICIDMGPSRLVGSHMLRWHLIPRNRFFNIYLHCILRSDWDRYLHDHPWWNISIPLNSYCEIKPREGWFTPFTEGQDPCYYVERRAFVPILRPPVSPHRIVIDRAVWSLFITGPVQRAWGFYTEKGWVHHSVYDKEASHVPR